ncbi:DUF1120 domain-containing protein [Enterobacter cloacae]|uniref:DUF1120 domain-containing protein n=1 Tax=Enterobacter cloacae TaxID=550 RepID=UPI001D01FDB1|nr:DUF1120 domain-containing protein [Enterobacter cloacae]UDG00687.1 DUF1120 domain-containing protein [Enterobacter cloacae]
MKKIFCIAALSLCIGSAYAAETSVMKVTGTLTNSACTPELDGGGVIDYGTIRLGELSSATDNQLGQKSINLAINCSAPTKVGWTMVDDRSSTTASGIIIQNAFITGATTESGDNNWTFGVGKTAEGVKIGAYSGFVQTGSVTADGASATLIHQQQGGSNWTACNNCYLQSTVRTYSVAAKGTSQPVAFTTATFPLKTSLAIEDTATLGITDDTPLDGQLTISLTYL